MPSSNQPLVSYQLYNIDDGERLNKAFDILFEETLKQNSNLTARDN